MVSQPYSRCAEFLVFWAMLSFRLTGCRVEWLRLWVRSTLIVIGLSRLFLAAPVRPLAIVAGLLGIVGVALLVLAPGAAALDAVGVAAGLAGAVSMAFGTVLTRKWRPPVSNLTFTARQLTAGGILLLPVAYLLEPALPAPTAANILGMAYLGIIGAALTYFLWFRVSPASNPLLQPRSVS